MPRPVFFNPSARSWTAPSPTNPHLVDTFHKQLPTYHPTPLVSLPPLANALGLAAVHVKAETDRLGLPSFKILGASWGTFCAIATQLELPLDSSLETIKAAVVASRNNVSLFAATDGNHGRAVARMGAVLGVPAEIHVPSTMDESTAVLIRSEDAVVVVSSGTYDEAILEAHEASKRKGGILVQDFAFGDYQDIPQWIVDGYSTMLREIDSQLTTPPSLVVCPVGVGSFAQAVVSHFKQPGRPTAVVTVEPDTAACLWKSLRLGTLTPQPTTTPTIMAGLDCGTPSATAWPLLRSGIDASLTVSDYEAHQAALDLRALGISAGPCGAASLAALRRLSPSDRAALGLGSSSVVVLLCTEGARSYAAPLPVSPDDPVSLAQTLNSIPGPSESSIARYVSAWLQHRDVETHWVEPTPGRPSVVGVVRGSGEGKSLLLSSHMDIVSSIDHASEPLSRDKKPGLAATMLAFAAAKKLTPLRGHVVFVTVVVADREASAAGTTETVRRKVQDIVDRLARDVPGFAAEVAVGAPYWIDCALLFDEDIPSLLWGGKGETLHAKEWVDMDSVQKVTEALTEMVKDFCK